jgi:hypothetical protein
MRSTLRSLTIVYIIRNRWSVKDHYPRRDAPLAVLDGSRFGSTSPSGTVVRYAILDDRLLVAGLAALTLSWPHAFPPNSLIQAVHQSLWDGSCWSGARCGVQGAGQGDLASFMDITEYCVLPNTDRKKGVARGSSCSVYCLQAI